MKFVDRVMIDDLSNLADLNELKTKVIYSDDFEELSKERQNEIYKFCKLHATCDACRENLVQIRYAISRIYFGW